LSLAFIFYFISNNNCRLLIINIVSFIFNYYWESKPQFFLYYEKSSPVNIVSSLWKIVRSSVILLLPLLTREKCTCGVHVWWKAEERWNTQYYYRESKLPFFLHYEKSNPLNIVSWKITWQKPRLHKRLYPIRVKDFKLCKSY
jgi:hypothetical protein